MRGCRRPGDGRLAYVIQRADVGIVQRGDAPGFTVEPFQELWIRRKLRAEYFDRNDAIKTAVTGFVDLAHAPSTEDRLDLIGTEERAGRKRVLGQVARLYQQ